MVNATLGRWGLVAAVVLSAGMASAQEKEPTVDGKTLTEWRAAFKSNDKQERLKAIKAFGQFGPAAKEVVPDLLRLADSDFNKTEAGPAVDSLGKIGAAAVPGAIKMLSRDNNIDRRILGAMIVKGAGPDARDAIPALIEALKDSVVPVRNGLDSYPQYQLRRAVADALGSVGGAAVPELIKVFKWREPDAYESAAVALGKIGPDAKDAVRPLMVVIKGVNVQRVRMEAVKALGSIGPDAREALDVLTETMHDKDIPVANGCPYALVKMGPDGIARVVAGLKEEDAQIRRNCASALGSPGAPTKDVAPILLGLIKDKDTSPELKGSLLHSLGRLRPVVKEAIPLFVEAVKDVKSPGRRSAVQSLGEFGPDAREAVPALVAMLGEKFDPANSASSMLYNEVIAALGKIGEDAVPAILGAMRDKDLLLRTNAGRAFHVMPMQARTDAVPKLIEMLRGEPTEFAVDDSRYIRDRTQLTSPSATALIVLGLPAVPKLIEALGDAKGGQRHKIATILGVMGRSTPRPMKELTEATPALVEALKADDAPTRREAAWALGYTDPDPTPASFALLIALKDEDDAVRTNAGESLRRINGSALLTESLKNDNVLVRRHAAYALLRPLGGFNRHVAKPVTEIPKEVVPILLAALKDADPRARQQAVDAIGSTSRVAPGKPRELLKDLVEPLEGLLAKDEDARVRESAARALVGYGELAEGSKPVLLKAAGDKDAGVRSAVILGLSVLRADPKVLLPLLKESIKDEDPRIQTAVLSALSMQGKENARETVPLLVEYLKGKDAARRTQAREIIQRLGPDAKDAIPALLEQFKAENEPRLKEQWAICLLSMGPEAKKAVPALVDLARDEEADKNLRVLVIYVIRRLDPEAAKEFPEKP